MTAVPREIENNAPNQKNASFIRGDATATIPSACENIRFSSLFTAEERGETDVFAGYNTLGTRGFSRVRRGASFRRPPTDTCSAEGRRHERRLTQTGNRASGT